MLVKIYTDGAARGNPDGPGGYGAGDRPAGKPRISQTQRVCLSAGRRRERQSGTADNGFGIGDGR